MAATGANSCKKRLEQNKVAKGCSETRVQEMQYFLISGNLCQNVYDFISPRVHMASVIIPLFIYVIVFDSSEGGNDRAYIPKKQRNSGWRFLMSSLKEMTCHLGNQIIRHAENMRCKQRLRHRHSTKLHVRKRPGKHSIALAALAAMACQAQKTHWEQRVSFDTDSYDIGVDNRCSACISGNPKDFFGNLYNCIDPIDSRHGF